MSTSPGPAGVLLAEDLLFASRILTTAQQLGQEVLLVRSPADLFSSLPQTPRCFLLDLACAGPAAAELIRQLKQRCVPPPLVIAFGAHVDAAGLRAAREAGSDLVLPRSKLVQELPRLLRHWLAGRTGPIETPSSGA